MIPITLMLALASSAMQYADASKKESKAKEEAKGAPKSVIPQSAKIALAESSNIAKGRSAGAAEAERAIKESAATASYRAERASTGSTQLQEAISGAQAAESKGIRRIAAAESSDTERRQSQYINQLFKMAELEKNIDDSNKSNEWNIEQGIKAAAAQQKFSAISQAANVGLMSTMDMTAEGNSKMSDFGDIKEPTNTTTPNNINKISKFSDVKPPVNTIIPKTIDKISVDQQPSILPMSQYQKYLQSGSNLPYTEWLKITNISNQPYS